MSLPSGALPAGSDEPALRRALWAGRVQPHPGECDRLMRALIAQHDGCLIWPGRTRKGRGRVSITVAGRRVEVDVHRAVFALVVGPIPAEKLVSQRCGNGQCARPDHMELVTPRTVWERGVAAGRIRPLRGWVDGHGPRRAA